MAYHVTMLSDWRAEVMETKWWRPRFGKVAILARITDWTVDQENPQGKQFYYWVFDVSRRRVKGKIARALQKAIIANRGEDWTEVFIGGKEP